MGKGLALPASSAACILAHDCGGLTPRSDKRESRAKEKTMSEQKRPYTEEEKQNHRYSFIVGIVIALAIIVAFTLFFH
ncbi:MAG TPA: hypothetical protein VFQ36_17895 [Ktedonobacteraceae bacterium]|nr:hypothetical protein [Ktedonobacteraceae bacterium]